MKSRKALIINSLAFFFALSCFVIAGPGDTTIVQTFTFNSPGNPKEGKFLFPPLSKRFEKILMYYTLKCDSRQNPACGEWDYLTYTNVFRHTGTYDSTLLKHSNFLVNRSIADTLQYMNTPSWNYYPRFEKYLTIKDTLSFKTTKIGSGTKQTSYPFGTGSPDARSMFLWRASELKSAGLNQSNISGIRLRLLAGSGTVSNLRIKIKSTTLDVLSSDSIDVSAFSTVYEHASVVLNTGWNSFVFATPFAWDGTSNLIVDFSFSKNSSSSNTFSADSLSWNAGMYSSEKDYFLSFDGKDNIDIPGALFSSLDSTITISFWQFGNPDAQPRDNTLCEGMSSAPNRVVNIHLPWSNGHIYWDAGNSGGTYDRIERAAGSASEYEGQWNHWAFTKNAVTGNSKIFLNGNLWHSGTGLKNSFTPIRSFKLGSGGDGTGLFYYGFIDEFNVWNIDLDQTAINKMMVHKPDKNDPVNSHLITSLLMNEGNGNLTSEDAGNKVLALTTHPRWMNYQGNRFKNFQTTQLRPEIIFEQGTFNSKLDSLVVIDSVMKPQMMIELFGDTTHPNIPTDTLYKWPTYIRYKYDALGKVVDSTMVGTDQILYRKEYNYYSAPFEVVNKFELGRFITPYGINLSLGEGWTWIYDVSDFRQLLADSVHLQAGNWQELLDLKFVMIEGTPARDVVKIENVWQGNFGLSTFATTVAPKTITLDQNATMFKLRTCVTGHGGGGPNNCAEFCPKTHSVDVDGITQFSWQIIQDCANNPLYPQGGTWVYDRAAWCPGMPCTTQQLELTPFIKGKQVTIDYNSDYDDYGNYVTESQLVSYSNPNFGLDAAIDEIITPNKYELYRRFNPSCGRPKIVIHNNGSAPLTSLDITYGPIGGNTNTFHWTGNLKFLEKEEMYLPAFDWGSWSGANTFSVRLSQANGGNDEYAFNNNLTVPFESVPVYGNDLIVLLKTNNEASENWYEVLDAGGNAVFTKTNLANSTSYKDTIKLNPGCYEFVLHDFGHDGISFWANPNAGNGTISFRLVGGGLFKSLLGDFGAETRMSFMITKPTFVEHMNNEVTSFQLFPNPANGHLEIVFALEKASHIRFEIFNLLGRKMKEYAEQQFDIGKHTAHIDMSDLAPGSYILRMISGQKVLRTLNVNVLR